MRELIMILNGTLPLWLKVSIGFLMAFTITTITIPTIVRVAQLKHLCAIPNKRTSHANEIPNLGGMALFSAFLITITTVAGDMMSYKIFYFICGLIIMFFIGMKDDVLIIDPRKKLAAQVLVAGIIAIMADIKVNTLFEIFNIGAISYVPSIILTILIILLIVNGYNLIDGIDGLAAGTGIIASVFSGFYFWSIGDASYTIICFSLAGSLVGFFLFNVYGRKNKIFLGDTGSLILGLAVSVLMIQLINPDIGERSTFTQASPSLALAILILPVFDTTRVFVLRIMQGKSPFTADRQHIHHLLLGMGYSHIKSTFVLLIVNLFFIGLCISLQNLGNMAVILIMFSIALTISVILKKMVLKRWLKIREAESRLEQESKTLVPEPSETELVDV